MKVGFAITAISMVYLFIFLTSCASNVETIYPNDNEQFAEKNTDNKYESVAVPEYEKPPKETVAYPDYEKSSETINITFNGVRLPLYMFSQNLFRKILASGEENVVFSPLSAYYALAAVALGALDDTLCEFSNLLGMDPHILAAKLSSLAEALIRSAGSTTVNIGGSAWINDNFTINSDFYQVMSYYFRSGAYSRDLSSQSTIDEINEWIYKKTQGLIENPINEIESNTVMLLINTLYFSARWARRLNPMYEQLGTFYLESGGYVETVFLSTGRDHIPLPVSVTDYYEAVFIPYDDERTGFIMIRPIDGTSIRDFVYAIDLKNILYNLNLHFSVQVQMPAIDKEFEVKMNEYLKAMGLVSAFYGNLSNFSGLVDETKYRIFISEVKQTARLHVHSEGTEAAAVTVNRMVPEGALIHPIELNFNTPYVFIIYDTLANVILFMGIVDNP